MSVLVTAASKHGSTEDIGRAIADELNSHGVGAEFASIVDIDDVRRFDAAVVGSAVYMGSWLQEACKWVEGNKGELLAMPVWLFSSGPVGLKDSQPKGDPKDVPGLMKAVKARGHRVFGGKLEKVKLSFGERLIANVLHAEYGDFRDWSAIRAWADEIAGELKVLEKAA